MNQLLLQTDTIHTIPVLTIAPAAAQRCPVIFFIPGYTGRKEDGLTLGYRLARRGFFFASFDPWLHGERYDNWLEQAALPERGGLYPPETGLDTAILFFRIIHQCLLDVQFLLSHWAADPRLDVSRCGVTGLSMGGYASFLIFASLPVMQAAVPMIGIPTFTRRWSDILDECALSNPAWALALRQVESQTSQHTAFIQQIDPSAQLPAAAPRALLIMNNDFDSDQPKHYAIQAYKALRPSYAAAPHCLQLNIYPAGHIVTSAMEQDAVDWFSRHLSP